MIQFKSFFPVLWGLLYIIYPFQLAFSQVPAEGKSYIGPVIEATLNGLKITINKESGSIIELSYPGPGKILEAKPGTGGILDVAYPIPEFEPLRLASRFSKGARIEKLDDAVMISWENLGASRAYFKSIGKVSAKVWLTAMPDGRSISMKCQVVNESERPVGQILFPDFQGLLPFAGKEDTYLRTVGFIRRPFIEVGPTLYPEFYAAERGDKKNTYSYTGGGNLGEGDKMIGRWFDYGGLNGGISLFPKLWTGAPLTKVRIFRMEKDPKVRLTHVHDLAIKPGERWESPEYILTPHRSGWAKGIEPYRDFVKSNVKRQYPVPQHVREGLGYRTIFMCKGFPADGEQDIAFKIKDLPGVAKETKEHGLDEIVIWFWNEFFQLPIPPPYAHLGTPEEFSTAIKECNKIGVNVSPFVSFISLAHPTASKYGLKLGAGGYTYHTELIPAFNAGYTKSRNTAIANPEDSLWRQDVLVSIRKIYDNYTHSISWDQAYPGTENIFKEFLPWVKERYPRATFSGEITGSAERCADFLDYTWNWESGSYYHNLMAPYRDLRAFNSSFPSPRMNYNINRNVEHIKYAFMDNSYLNIMPSKPDDANGTAWIKDEAGLSRVLKQCASLRRQFLKYFTDGTLIAECLLKEPSRGTHVNAYVLSDRVLLIIMNTRNESRRIDFKVDLEPWLRSAAAKYEVKSYDQYGKNLNAHTINGYEWTGKTSVLGNYDLQIFEFVKK